MIRDLEEGAGGAKAEKDIGMNYVWRFDYYLIVFLCIIFFSAKLSIASEQGQSFKDWIDEFRIEALRNGISKETLNTALVGLEPVPRVVELDRSQPESRLSLEQYVARVVSERRVARGRQLLVEYRVLLGRVTEQYGVPAEVLVSLWGIESDFGRVTGDFPVLAALASLAYDGRRGEYFEKELIFALRIIDKKLISPELMKGSWAGAMGNLQFMPSVFYQYAVDYNNDGKVDPWNDMADAFASAANYLSQSGWKRDQGWGFEVQFPASSKLEPAGLKHVRPLSEWLTLGVRLSGANDLPAESMTAYIVQPDGQGGRSFALFNNYQALLRWNRSHNFAISIGILSDRLLEN